MVIPLRIQWFFVRLLRWLVIGHCFYGIFGGFAILNAQSVVQRPVTLHLPALPVPEVLRQVSDSTGIALLFSDDFFKNTPPAAPLRVHQQPIERVLTTLLANSDIGFKANGPQTIVLFRLPPPDIRYTGQVVDAETGEPLAGATVVAPATQRWASTNAVGLFQLRLPPGPASVRVQYVGYISQTLGLDTTNQAIALRPNAPLHEVQVTSNNAGSNPQQTGLLYLPEKWTRAVMFTAGESDIMRQLTLLPGFQSGADGFGGLHVRGGNSDQNQILVDGVPVYNPSHALGLLSVVHPGMVRDVRLYKGVQPANYGGRLSSVVDIRLRDANRHQWHAEVSASPITTSVLAEGPLGKKCGSLLLSARVSLLGSWIGHLLPNSSRDDVLFHVRKLSFNDGYLKWSHYLGHKHRLSFTHYGGADYFNEFARLESQTPDSFIFVDTLRTDYSWGNTFQTFRWQWQPNHRWSGTTSLSNSGFQYNVTNTISTFIYDGKDSILFSSGVSYRLKSDVREQYLRSDWVWEPNHHNTVLLGTAVSRHIFRPLVFSIGIVDADSLALAEAEAIKNSKITSAEWSGYGEYLHERAHWATALGIRTSFFRSSRSRWSVQPRWRVALVWSPKSKLELSVGQQEQFIQALTFTDFALPSDIWIPFGRFSPRMTNRQVTLAWHQSLPDSFQLTVEAYYKKSRGLSFFSRESWYALSDGFLLNDIIWDSLGTFGTGKSRGLEFLLEKQAGKITGLFSYTLSKNERQVGNQTQPYRFDARHQLSWSAIVRLGRRWHVSALWQYSSGIIPSDLSEEPLSQFAAGLFGSVSFGSEPPARLPDVHRLDLSAHVAFSWKKWAIKSVFGLYNVYNRRNIIYVYNRALVNFSAPEEYRGVVSLPMMPTFRLILSR
jgi:hypothetical protein